MDVAAKIREYNMSDYIEQTVDLHPAAHGEMSGLCPFHNDKNPSFFVNDDKGLWHCFACNTGGDLISFVEQQDNVEFIDAIKSIADFYHFDLDFNQGYDAARQEKKQLEELLDKVKNTMNYELMNTKSGQSALDAVKARGYSEDMIKHFGLGLATNSNIIELFKKLDIPLEQQIKTKLVYVNKQNKLVQTQRNRIIFPIRNISGHLIGFSGRTLDPNYQNDKYTPKYKHALSTTDEQAYFFDDRIKKQPIKIVEGFYDVMAFADAGIENSISTLGTSVSDEQLVEITNKSNIISVIQDGDDAGMNSADRLIKKVDEMNDSNDLLAKISLDVTLIPDNLDVDDYRKKFGNDGLSKFVLDNKNKLSALQFEMKLAEHDGEIIPGDSASLIRQGSYIIEQFAVDPTEKYLEYQKIADKAGLPVEVVKEQGQLEAAKIQAKLQQEQARKDKKASYGKTESGQTNSNYSNNDNQVDEFEDLGFGPTPQKSSQPTTNNSNAVGGQVSDNRVNDKPDQVDQIKSTESSVQTNVNLDLEPQTSVNSSNDQDDLGFGGQTVDSQDDDLLDISSILEPEKKTIPSTDDSSKPDLDAGSSNSNNDELDLDVGDLLDNGLDYEALERSNAIVEQMNTSRLAARERTVLVYIHQHKSSNESFGRLRGLLQHDYAKLVYDYLTTGKSLDNDVIAESFLESVVNTTKIISESELSRVSRELNSFGANELKQEETYISISSTDDPDELNKLLNVLRGTNKD